MKQIEFPTINADRHSHITSSYPYSSFDYGMPWENYPSTFIKVPHPDACPCCNKVMSDDLSPIMAINNINNGEKEYKGCKVVSIYRCASCNSLFAIWSEHKAVTQDETAQEGLSYTCKIVAEFPFEKTTTFTPDITNLSAEFVSIFNQAEVAEAQNLNEICGMGYRRALEYLVDAYIRKNRPTEAIDANLPLGIKIRNYIDNEQIRTLAEKSAWLGNDATHIINNHPDRSVIDIKKFIKAITSIIDTEFACEDASTIERN